jgi:hypothetical protein
VSDSPKGNELCAKCSYTYDGHIGNTGCLYPCWTPSGRYRAVPPSPSGQPPRPMRCLDGLHQFTAPATVCQCGKRTLAPYSPPTGSDTRTLCAVCGIWQCLARHGGGTCHAVNGPADVSCGACYANRPTVKPDLTVASEEPPACRQRAASLHPRLGLSYACVLTAGHNGECAPGGTCFEHGPYIGKPGTTPRCPKCPSPTITFVPAAVASPLPEEPPTADPFWATIKPGDVLPDTRCRELEGNLSEFGETPDFHQTIALLISHHSLRQQFDAAESERSRLAGENAELRQPPTDPRALYVQLRDAIAALQSENAELRKDAERWQYFRRFLSVERDRYTPTQYVVADVNLIVETTVREGVNHTVELLVDAARFSAGATGDRE